MVLSTQTLKEAFLPTLKIKDVPLLSSLTGTEKIPTGGRGNFTTNPDQLAAFFNTATEWDLEAAASITEVDLTPMQGTTSVLSLNPQGNQVLETSNISGLPVSPYFGAYALAESLEVTYPLVISMELKNTQASIFSLTPLNLNANDSLNSALENGSSTGDFAVFCSAYGGSIGINIITPTGIIELAPTANINNTITVNINSELVMTVEGIPDLFWNLDPLIAKKFSIAQLSLGTSPLRPLVFNIKTNSGSSFPIGWKTGSIFKVTSSGVHDLSNTQLRANDYVTVLNDGTELLVHRLTSEVTLPDIPAIITQESQEGGIINNTIEAEIVDSLAPGGVTNNTINTKITSSVASGGTVHTFVTNYVPSVVSAGIINSLLQLGVSHLYLYTRLIDSNKFNYDLSQTYYFNLQNNAATVVKEDTVIDFVYPLVTVFYQAVMEYGTVSKTFYQTLSGFKEIPEGCLLEELSSWPTTDPNYTSGFRPNTIKAGTNIVCYLGIDKYSFGSLAYNYGSDYIFGSAVSVLSYNTLFNMPLSGRISHSLLKDSTKIINGSPSYFRISNDVYTLDLTGSLITSLTIDPSGPGQTIKFYIKTDLIKTLVFELRNSSGNSHYPYGFAIVGQHLTSAPYGPSNQIQPTLTVHPDSVYEITLTCLQTLGTSNPNVFIPEYTRNSMITVESKHFAVGT